MTPGERVNLKRAIADSLAVDDKPEADLILAEFGQPTEEWHGQKTEYILKMLRHASDQELQALGAYLLGEGETDELPADDGRWQPDKFRLFISHIWEQRDFITQVKHVLASEGVDCFVAHMDIRPSAEWVAAIEMSLWSCDAVAAFLHKGFRASKWCDQEVGIAEGRRKPILPIAIEGEMPHGFIGRYQAVKCGGQSPRNVASLIISSFLERADTRNKMIDAQLAALVSSRGWDRSNGIAKRLQPIMDARDWRPERLAQLRKALTNREVSQAFDAQPWATRVLRKHDPTPPVDDDVPF